MVFVPWIFQLFKVEHEFLRAKFFLKLQVFMNIANPKTNLDPCPQTFKGGGGWSNTTSTSCCDSLQNSMSDPRSKV